MKELSLEFKLNQLKTNHILHLILSAITFGFWLPVWLIVEVRNGTKRQNLMVGVK